MSPFEHWARVGTVEINVEGDSQETFFLGVFRRSRNNETWRGARERGEGGEREGGREGERGRREAESAWMYTPEHSAS